MSHVIDLQGKLLAISCNGVDTGGGVFLSDGSDVEQVDEISTTGLWVDDDQRMVVRGFLSQEAGSRGELLTYDREGVTRYLRVDDLHDTHDVRWDGTHLVAVSTSSNEVLWITTGGDVARRWNPGGQGDAYHLNSLELHDGRLIVSAFGRFERHRDWQGTFGQARGIVMEVGTDRVVIDGLESPHDPRFVDGSWLVCNSRTGDLLQFTPDGSRVERTIPLGGWTRGMAWTSELLFVGVSASRTEQATGRAAIVVLDRATFAERARIPLPKQEVYDIALVSPELAHGLRSGFRTNATRVQEQDRLDLLRAGGKPTELLWTTGEPLELEDSKVTVTAELPFQLEAGRLERFRCTVTNRGAAALVTARPNPVSISYRWRALDTGREQEDLDVLQIRSPLKQGLAPGETGAYEWELQSPTTTGTYELTLTVIQEFVRWFDTQDSDSAMVFRIDIVEPAP